MSNANQRYQGLGHFLIFRGKFIDLKTCGCIISDGAASVCGRSYFTVIPSLYWRSTAAVTAKELT